MPKENSWKLDDSSLEPYKAKAVLWLIEMCFV